MPIIQNLDDIDRQIMQLRALGYHQTAIANKLNMSQSTISQRVERIRNISENTDDKDREKLFWTLIIGAGALYLLSRLNDERNR